MVELTSVKSSNIAAIGYDEETSELEILFKNGQSYCHSNVPAQLARDLLTAESVGKLYAAEIRGIFPHKKIEKKKESENADS